jgi:hypothetical protein
MGFPENGLYHQSTRREDPMRRRRLTPPDVARQPPWTDWIADALGRCPLLAATLGPAASA